MADYRATSAEITAVADAIRTKGSTSSPLAWPNGFVSAVQAIPTSSGVVQPLSVTRNGVYYPQSGVDGYAPVTVNVSDGSGLPVWYSNDGTLAAFVDQINERVVWYFMGYTKGDRDAVIPPEMCIPENNSIYSMAYDSDKETQIGWIGFFEGKIRSRDTTFSYDPTGPFWGVVYSDGGTGQTNPYSDPPQ